MTVTYISIVIIAFLLGFKLGQKYISKGLALRVEQLFQEGDHPKAELFKEALKRYENEYNKLN